jgi:hypothetical protein
MRPMMDKEGLQDVGLAPGEISNWETFGRWYAPFIYADPVATKNIGLITSHGFGLGRAANNSLGVDTLRQVRPDLHAWNTSMTFIPGGFARAAANPAWGANTFIEMVRQNIYDAKVNGIIPWSVIQSEARGPDQENPANPHWHTWVGTAFFADRKGGTGPTQGTIFISTCRAPGNRGWQWPK